MSSMAKIAPCGRAGKRGAAAPRPHPATHGLALSGGLERIPDEALLSSLLSMAVPEADGDLLALRLLAAHGSIADAVAAASMGKLPAGVALDGHAVLRLQAVIELAARLVRPAPERPALASHDSLVTYARLRSSCHPVQALRLLFLDGRHHLIADEIHQTGTVTDVALYVREIIARALVLEARGLVIVHSFPNDDPPSTVSARLSCSDLRQAGSLLGIELIEYVLVGRRSYVALLREAGAEPAAGRPPRLVAAERGGRKPPGEGGG